MKFIKTLLIPMALVMGVSFAQASEMGEDGLHKADWQHETFLDLREDHAEAAAEGKTLLIMWEQRGCIYCKKLHEEILVEPELEAMLNDEFFVVQLNLFGDRETVDFDGEEMSERDLAMKNGIMFTPTLMMFDDEVPENVTLKEAAVVNLPSAFGKFTITNLFTWVREKGYNTDENFQKYHARKIMEARERGELPSE